MQATTLPSANQAALNSGMMADGQASVATNETEIEPRSFGHQTTQSTMSIEQILTLAQTGTLEQVIQEGNNMVCQVSSHYRHVKIAPNINACF